MPDGVSPLPPEVAAGSPGPLSPIALAWVTGRLDPGTDEARAEEARAEGDAWRITDDGAAEWAMGRLAEAQARIAEASELHRRWAERLAAWLDERVRTDRATVSFMEAHLTEYALTRRERGGAAMLRLPSGSIRTRSTPPRAQVVKPDEFVAWAKDSAPDLVRIKEEPDLRAFAEAVQQVERVRVWLVGSCGHRLDADSSDEWVLESDGARGSMTCAVCDSSVDVLDVEQEDERVVVYGGEVVPGAEVSAPSVSAWVVVAP